MKAVVQRVQSAAVLVSGERVGEIDQGLMVLLAVERGDGPEQVAKMVHKLSGLRIFSDDRGRMDRSVRDIGGAVLAVSQFTLAATLAKGFRPSFDGAEAPESALLLFELFCRQLTATGVPVATGRFGADMQVHLVNDGPVTFILEYPPTRSRES
ncbi:MAG: D-tyrosyl-tRNA(Tyr) deacylase [Magnetococcales bacterium]|nr:D-tyrosyl-tRNA(Tyr) deacylase [Magnetococcales bacterium]NGZ06790.1 D-tyrosyl-tRNA(Tyr) deacylase [Magnetococcales bacterium]